jgi:3-oxoadipate enol-lactonase
MTATLIDLPERRVELCSVRGGEGPTLLVINGTGSDLRNQPNALAWPISDRFDIVTYDHRCLGRSEQYDTDYQPNMADFAEDALALCDQQGIDTSSILGISFGGMVAQEVAIRAGDRISKLILCCTSSGGAGGASYPLHELYAQGVGLDERVHLWDTRAATDEKVAAQLQRMFAGRIAQPDEPPPGLLKQVEARRLHDTFARLGAIAAPTLIAYGRFDGVAPPANSEALAAGIGDATLAPFEGGHMFLWQDPAAWPAIAEFLGG